jgi:hypothetical protein
MSTILKLCTEFVTKRLIVICGCDYSEFICLVKSYMIPKALMQYDIYQLFKYVSDFIWMLGKNNFERFGACINCAQASAETKII